MNYPDAEHRGIGLVLCEPPRFATLVPRCSPPRGKLRFPRPPFLFQITGAEHRGIWNDLKRRIYEHKNNLIDGFTKEYNIHTLVYYESCNDINSAINREKVLKRFQRQWKINLIERNNPYWRDLEL